VIDAAEFVGPHDDERANYVRVARFYYAPGFWEPGARLHFMSNQRAYAMRCRTSTSTRSTSPAPRRMRTWSRATTT
jgi:TRAP-type mannitol/chloroaromatic compound transport system substrate-binding protein